MRLLSLCCLLCAAGGVYADSAKPSGSVDTGSQVLVARANALLSTGQFNEAAKAYTDAIELAPGDYLLYYKRATAYMSSNRHPNALDDFDKVLMLTSNTFSNAWLMKAKIHTKDGKWQEARSNLKLYATKVKTDTTATDMSFAISDAENAEAKAVKAHKSELWSACAETASQALKTASHSLRIRQMRAECALAAGDFEGAVGDLGRLTHLSSPSTTSLIRLFRIAYFFLPISDTPNALSPLKTCLHLDPDSKPCLTAHRLVKAFSKSFTKLEELLAAENWRGAILLLTGPGKAADLAAKFDAALETHTSREALFDVAADPSSAKIPLPDPKLYSPRRIEIFRAVCKAYVQVGSPRKAEPWCETLLTMQGMEEDVDGLVGKGEAAMLKEDWNEAVRVLDKAFEVSGRNNRDIHQRLQKAQKLLKVSKQKDYYKVLGVARDADTRTIKKAFRKAAMTAHPDKGGSEDKMASVNEAYEVLSKPELRQRFDEGDDPNDPTSQQGGGHPFGGGGGGGHPFAQFFQQQGGGFPGGGSGGFQFNYGG